MISASSTDTGLAVSVSTSVDENDFVSACGYPLLYFISMTVVMLNRSEKAYQCFMTA